MRWFREIVGRGLETALEVMGDKRRRLSVSLTPIGCVQVDQGNYYSADACPWLLVNFPTGIPAGRWISIRYKASFYDELVRPIIRFRTEIADYDLPMPAALFGSGLWRGYVPLKTIEIRLSPVNYAGRFGFQLETCTTLPFVHVVCAALLGDPAKVFGAIVLAISGATAAARQRLRCAIGVKFLDSYHEWRARRIRNVELEYLERPRSDWQTGPHVRLIMHAAEVISTTEVDATIRSLCAQAYPNWSLVVTSSRSISMLGADRISFISIRSNTIARSEMAASVLWEDLTRPFLLSPLVPGHLLPRYALAVLAEYAMSHPDIEIIYADEDEVDSKGRFVGPALKPDWSPIFQASSRYVGQALYFRASVFSSNTDVKITDVTVDSLFVQRLLSSDSVHVGHLRRVTLTKPTDAQRGKEAPPPLASCGPRAIAGPYAAIIIPSKDQPQKLAECLASIRCTRPFNIEIIIVDNGSTASELKGLYTSCRLDPRISIIDAPGPFNFSTLCNRGVACSTAPLVVFLNNDTVALSADWLMQMASWALRPDIGAVGAKLIYPSGRLQHGGVIVGLGGYAAHVDRDSPAGFPGYLMRATSPHEVSAVTAACLAVEKKKFNAVGGFDEERFPVELNDIDLCLRLGGAGWRTIFTPQPTLIHHESATRGFARRPEQTYGHEQRQFSERWGVRIRDDPYFHPALSLQSTRTALE